MIKPTKHPVIGFYLLAFAISWLGWLPVVAGSRGIVPFDHPAFQLLLILPAIGPALAAIVVTQAWEGKTGVTRLLGQLVRWRVEARWWVAAAVAPALFLVAGKAITDVLNLSAAPSLQGNIVALALSAFVVSLPANLGEEIGWRGFALPRLQKSCSALVATLIVGVLWGAWHLPLFFWVGNPMSSYPLIAWFAGTVAVSFVYTWLYNGSRGSLLVVTLFHVLGNTFGVIISGVSIVGLTIVYCAAAAFLIMRFGAHNLAAHERVFVS